MGVGVGDLRSLVSGLGSRVLDLGSRVSGLWFSVSHVGLGFQLRDIRFGVRALGLDFEFGVRALGFGLGIFSHTKY